MTHEIKIMYTNSSNVYQQDTYEYANNIYISIWLEKLLIEYTSILTDNTLFQEYDLSHVIALEIDGKLIELEDEQ